MALAASLALVTAAAAAAATPACPFHQSTDMATAGGDLCQGGAGHGHIPLCNKTSTAERCFELCAQEARCCCFSWMPDGHTCYLKAGTESSLRGGIARVSGCQNTSACGGCAEQPIPAPPGPPVPVIPGGPSGQHYACQAPNDHHDFCNTSKSFVERTDLLVAALSPEELVAAVNQGGATRLGVPPMGAVGAECLHGVRMWPPKCPFSDREGLNCTTIFPAASALSRSFNRTMWRQVGAAMADEGRVLFNAGITKSLYFTGPQLNVQRDPRWGRNSNSPSEDPFHTGAYGKAVTEGFQGGIPVAGSVLPRDHRYTKIANMMKHWTAYGVESNWWAGAPQGRMGFDANISIHDLVDTYFVGMRMAAEANISSAMCAYDAINGTPSCINGWMTNAVARGTWGWEGAVYTDCGALTNVNKHFHKFQPSQHVLMDTTFSHIGTPDEHTAAAAIKQGTDLECDSVLKNNLAAALNHGLLNVEELRQSVKRTFFMFMKLGMFDKVSEQPMANYNDTSVVAGEQHRKLALESARESVVLLQNPHYGANKILPLNKGNGTKDVSSILVGGPNSNLTDAFLGEYRPVPCVDGTTNCLTTALQAIQDRTTAVVTHVSGCTDGPACNTLSVAAAVATAEKSDVSILVIGLKYSGEGTKGGETTNGEGTDRHNISLPGKQQALCEAIIAVGKPTVLVVLGGGSVSVDFAKDHPSVAIISMASGGQAGAQALADVLMGTVSPSGRLPHTMYSKDWERMTAMSDMSMQAGAGRSYRWLDTTKSAPLFEFGTGLSYTTFRLKFATTVWTAAPGRHAVVVTNTGTTSSANVVLVFARARCDLDKSSSFPSSQLAALVPVKSLIDFSRTEILAPGQEETLSFTVADEQLALVNATGARLLCKGEFDLSFFDGVNTLTVTHAVAKPAVISTIPLPPQYR